MSGSFDPYHTWLGIPPRDQPPDHYRLLGVDSFEGNLEVIESAADRQMAHVRTFQAGGHSAESQQLLSEIATARITLLRAEKKAEYDNALRAQLEAKKPKAVALPVAIPMAVGQATDGPVASQFEQIRTNAAGTSPPDRLRNRGKPLWKNPAFLAAVLVGLVAGAFALNQLANSRKVAGRDEESSAVSVDENDSAVEQASTRPGDASTRQETQEDRTPPVANLHTDSVRPKTTPPNTAPSNTRPPANPPSPVDRSPQTAVGPMQPIPPRRPGVLGDLVPGSPSPRPGAVVVPKPTVKRLPLPPAGERQEVEAEIKTVFSDEYTAAEDIEGKMPLAQTLLLKQKQSGVDATTRFVMLKEATRLAAEAGEVAIAVDALQSLETAYEFKVWKLRVMTASQLGRKVRTDEARHAVAEVAMPWVQPALDAEENEAALEFAEVAEKMAIRVVNTALRKQAVHLVKKARFAIAARTRVLPDMEILERTPDDPEANLAVGKYYCLTKGNWLLGLPYLAKGNDDELKAAAAADLAKPTELSERVAAGGNWWSLIEKLSKPEQESALLRAREWYDSVLQDIQTSPTPGREQQLARMSAEKQVAKIDEALEEHLPPAPPMPRRRSNGLWGRIAVAGRDTGAVICYHHGALLRHSRLRSFFSSQRIYGSGIRIELIGMVYVAKKTDVAVQIQGGSSYGGTTTLQVDGKVLGTSGTRRLTPTTHKIELTPGSHDLRWVLSGTSLGDANRIAIVDSKTNQPLPVFCPQNTVSRLQAGSAVFINVPIE